MSDVKQESLANAKVRIIT